MYLFYKKHKRTIRSIITFCISFIAWKYSFDEFQGPLWEDIFFLFVGFFGLLFLEDYFLYEIKRIYYQRQGLNRKGLTDPVDKFFDALGEPLEILNDDFYVWYYRLKWLYPVIAISVEIFFWQKYYPLSFFYSCIRIAGTLILTHLTLGFLVLVGAYCIYYVKLCVKKIKRTVERFRAWLDKRNRF